MATELAVAYITITAETSGIPRQIGQAFGQAGTEADRAGRTAGQRFSSGFGSTMKGMLGAAGVTGGLSMVVGAMKSAISSGMDFTNALNTMKAVSGATDQQLAAVSAKARQLGTDNQLAATSSVDAAQAMLELSKGGMSVDQSMAAARGTLQLAAAAQIDAAEAATIQSSALQTFGKDASYAGQTADILANAANQSSAEITDVAYALQAGGTVANQFGISMSDTAATISLLANTGIKGSDAGTLLKTSLLALTDTTEKQRDAAVSLGLTLTGNGVKFEGMQDLFTKLGNASKTMTREQYNAATSTLFGADAIRLAGAAATAGGEGFAKMAASMLKQGAASDVAAAKMAGLPGAWEKLKNSAQDAGLAFYDVVKGPLTSLANFGSDAIETVVKKFTDAGPKAKEAWGQLSGAVKDSGILDEWGDRLKSLLSSVGDSIVNLAPAIGKVSEIFGMASTMVGAVGIETFVTALETLASLLEIGVVPVAQALNSVMTSMQPLVVAAVAAFMGFKMVAPALAAVNTNLAALQAKTMAAAGHVTSFASGWRQTVQWMRASNPSMSALGASMRLLGVGLTTHVPTLSAMGQAYTTTAANASTLGRTQGVLRAGMVGVRGAVSGLAGALGGPLSAALIGASVAFMVVTSKNSKSTAALEAYDTAVKSLTGSQNDLYVALMKAHGAVTDDVFSAQQKHVENLQAKLDAAGKSTGSFLDMFRGAGSDGSIWDSYIGGMAEVGEKLTMGLAFDHTSQNDRLNQMGKEAQEVSASLSKLGYTNETLTRAVYGSDGAFNQLLGTLKKPDGSWGNEQAKTLAADWTAARQKFQEQQDLAKKVVPGITELGQAFEVMGNKSSSASDKLTALKSAMDLLNPARSKAEAMAQFGETIRKAAESVQGIDKTAFKGDQLDSFSEAGKNLGDTLTDLAEKSAQVAANGGDMSKVAAENEKVFEALASATGKPIEKIRELYGQMGGDVVNMTVALKGDTEVTQKLGLVQTALKNTEKDKPTIVMKTDIAGAESALTKLGFKLKDMPDGKTVQITATGNAKEMLDKVVAAMAQMPSGKAVNVTAPGGQDVKSLLDQLGVQTKIDNNKNIVVESPLAPGIKQLLQEIGLEVRTNNGKNIIVTQTGAEAVQAKLDQIKLNDGKTITINIQEVKTQIARNGSGIPYRPEVIDKARQGNANGSIRQYVDGGITALESYANGGTRLPKQAVIQKADPAGGLVQWAEPSTDGEAFIPLANGKRARSLSILSTVAKMFGYEVLPEGTIPTSVSGLAGGLAGGLVKHLVAKTGVDGITKFADGGFTSARTASEFRQLAEGGFGASMPLTGAPYNWGGVNWGDCCLIAETPVWGPDGVTPIAELRPGQRVWSYVDGKLEAHLVTAAWFSKTQETFTVRTRQRAVTGSANHPFLRLVETAPARPRVGRRGWEPAEYDVEWARLDELSAGDLLVQPKAVRLERAVSNSLPSGRPIGLLEAWLLGVILGDGNVSDTKVEICVYGDLRDRVRDILGRMHVGASRTRGERDGISTSDSDAHGIRAYSTEFARELTEAGFRKPAHEKRIPECVWGWDEERQRAFLNGYCDADGHHPADVARHGERTYSSSSRALIESVRYLHVVLGDAVANVSTNLRRKPIVINGTAVKSARPLHTISVRLGESVIGSVAAARRPGVASWIGTSEFTVAPILSIDDSDVVDTYDITVEGAHNFIAGGVVVHNSGAMSAFARFAAGLDIFTGRFSTATMASQLQQMGAIMGLGPSGSMRFGWYNGGAGGGHTAGTLPDGTNVEMGGANGGGMLGGDVGADSSQFTDHAYFPVKSETTDSTTLNPDGTPKTTVDPTNTTTTTTTTTSSESGEKTLSARLGKVAESFVSGQVSSFLDLLSVNDSPGWLAAIAEYEKEHKKKDGTTKTGSKLTDAEKLQLKQDYDAAKLQRKQDYDTEIQKLDDQYTAKTLSKADYEQKKLDAKKRHEEADLKAKQEYDAKLGKTTETDGGAKVDYEQRKLDRKQVYDAEVERIKAEYKGRKLSDTEKAEQKRRLGELKTKHENEDLKAQQDYEKLKLSGSQKYDRSELDRKTRLKQQPKSVVKDPGTDKPKKGTDLPLPKLFDRGGSFGPGLNLVQNNLGKTETGLPFSPDELKRSLEAGGSGNTAVVAKLDQLLSAFQNMPRGQAVYNFPNDRNVERAEKNEKRRQKTALAGW